MSLTVAQLEATALAARTAYRIAKGGYYKGVASVAVTSAGTGYPTAVGACYAVFNGGTSPGYGLVATDSNGVITGVSLLEPGVFASTPTVTIVGATGSGGNLTPTLGPGVTASAGAGLAYASAGATYADALAQLAKTIDPATAASAAQVSLVADAQQALSDAQAAITNPPTAQPVSPAAIAAGLNAQTALLAAVDKQQKLSSGVGTPVNVGA